MTAERDNQNNKFLRLRKSVSNFCDSGIKKPLRSGMSSLLCLKTNTNLSEEDLDFLAAHTACDKEQLKIQFENFLEKHPNGAISKRDFRNLMKSCFPKQDSTVLERNIFNMYDTNRDGSISFKELMIVMYIMSNGSVEDNLKQIFKVFDANGNGMISKKEMKKLIQDIYHLLDDGKPDKGNKNKKALTENAMREMDADNDGRISEEEFVKAVLNQQKVAKLLTLKVVQVFDPDTTQSKLTS